MPAQESQRRLSAVLHADVVGFSRLIAVDEGHTILALKTLVEAIGAMVRQHGGRVVDAAGDNVLAEFPSVVNGVACAIALQREMRSRNADIPAERRLEIRVGVHLGDVVVDGEKIFGDGVNIAARIEAMADPGGVCISGPVYDQVANRIPEHLESLGAHSLENIPGTVNVFRVSFDPLKKTAATAIRRIPVVIQDGDQRVRLRVGDGEWLVDSSRRELSIGRSKGNDIVIDEPYVSRKHATVSYRDGEIGFGDQSSNGSDVRDSKFRVHVNQDTVALTGEGTVCLGQTDEPQVSFAVERYDSRLGEWRVGSESPPVSGEEQDSTGRYVFRREGDFWTLLYGGEILRLKHSKGLELIAHLLRHPGEEIHALDLASLITDQQPPPKRKGVASPPLEGNHVSRAGGAGPLLDAAAKAAYKNRLADLREELDEAEEFNDVGRAERVRGEMDFLQKQLVEAVGLGGRDRPTASNAERARVMVTHRIRDTMKKVRLGHPGLNAHLTAALRTGTFCSYSPDAESKVPWSF